MKELIEVPRLHEIRDIPETAILSVLEHALLVGSSSLIVEHPPIGNVSECYEGRVPPRTVMLAQLIVDRCKELSDLICWYRRSCAQLLTKHSIFAEDREEQELF